MAQGKRTVLITGAASGIGRVTALHFAGAGARLALLDRQASVERTSAEAAQLGAQAQSWILDVADGSAVQAAVEAIEQRLGPIECLVNGAAIVDHVAPLAKMKPERWAEENRQALQLYRRAWEFFCGAQDMYEAKGLEIPSRLLDRVRESKMLEVMCRKRAT